MARRPKSETAALMASPEEIEIEFYEALQRGDLERLMAVWADDDEVVCVHPGGPRVVGPAAVRATFEAIFANGPVHVRPEQVRRVQGPGCAVHNLLERVEVLTDEGPLTAWVMATNVYLKGPQGWRLVAHHASGGSREEPPEISEAPTVLH
ncbi:nuclear transport factor 2 family protein [uncultured Azohydromonas sp.]|jgi:Ketosteroid isomerase homolog|uniref:YybH family protein n=1 Tax=uncultured Azohydromonas sp. TaxID=487342 RepID=UPI002622B72A|nr:nuclear transport factor 2 family protein [uncultured Azohydromonas sp.]